MEISRGENDETDPSVVMGWVELSWGGVLPPCADPNPGEEAPDSKPWGCHLFGPSKAYLKYWDIVKQQTILRKTPKKNL